MIATRVRNQYMNGPENSRTQREKTRFFSPARRRAVSFFWRPSPSSVVVYLSVSCIGRCRRRGIAALLQDTSPMAWTVEMQEMLCGAILLYLKYFLKYMSAVSRRALLGENDRKKNVYEQPRWGGREPARDRKRAGGSDQRQGSFALQQRSLLGGVECVRTSVRVGRVSD